MSLTGGRATSCIAGLLFALVSGAPLIADDTELFVFDADALDVNPNILFILDTSGSMDTEVESQQTFDAAEAYEGGCTAGRVYWRQGTGDPPGCGTDRWFETSALRCAAAAEAFGGSGFMTDRVGRYDATTDRWRVLDGASDALVECRSDAGTHGDAGGSSAVYAQDGVTGAPWSDTATDQIDWTTLDEVTLFSGNYLNWYHGPTNSSTRMEVLQNVARGLAGSINGVNVGLMRFNGDDGGRLVHAVEDVAADRAALLDSIDSLNPSGMTPLSETMYEAALYFLGRPPHYGDGTGVSDGRYVSPIQHACQKSFIVYLSDGEPSRDTDAAELAPALPGFNGLVGASCDGSGDGACLDDLAEYLYRADLSDLPGQQNVTTYTIGFALDLPLLSSTAQRGGGKYYVADDTATLSQALTNIVTSILETQTTFTAPTVSIDSLNQTRHRNDVFVSVFQPTQRLHWPGNLKKYTLRPEDATIVDADGAPAIDPSTGFFFDDARSAWSDGPDGRRVTVGGAASRLPAPGDRNVYTWLGASGLLTAGANAVTHANEALDETVLGIGDPGDPARETVIDFMLGRDVGDADQDGDTDEARRQMGDPLHAQPASLVYGGTTSNPDPSDALVFFATNDGFLHAIDPETGVERWAFVPPEFLPAQADLLENPASPSKHYGIDGNLRLQVLGGEDGVIDSTAGDKAYLFFGMRRGGTVYYGLDVSDPAAPRLLWQLDESDLPGVGQTWSSPVPTRIDVQGAAQNDDDLVLVFGGGYDPRQDHHDATTDSIGNALYVVDSVSGELLWHGAQSGGTRSFSAMRYSIPADVKVIDLDGDRYADRLYAADMGGQVWRFDVANGAYASSLIAGSVMARLGSAGLASPSLADTRRFYYAPDVALVANDQGSFLHVGIGSGYRAHPNSTDNADRYYALRDYDTFERLTQTDHDSRPLVTEADLLDVTDDIDAVVPAGSAGWLLRLAPGEKVLSEARTFANEVYFTTFTPDAQPDAAGCEPRLGSNRLYVMSLFNGAPVNNLDGSVDDGEELTLADRSRSFQGSIATEVTFLFPSPEAPQECVGEACDSEPARVPPPLACVGMYCFPTGFGNDPVRTFWSQRNVDP